MERFVNKFLDAVGNLAFNEEYQFIYTISIIKTRLHISKCLYKEMKRINLNNDQEIFDYFEEENRIALMEFILSSLEIIQDRWKANNKIRDHP